MTRNKIRRDRKIKAGIDFNKVAKIWKVLAESPGWLHISEIARRCGIKGPTVRYYLNNYFANFINEQRINESIKLRLIELKEDATWNRLVTYLKSVEAIKRVHK